MGVQHTICTSPCHRMFYAHTNDLPCVESAGDVSVYGLGLLKQKGKGLLKYCLGSFSYIAVHPYRYSWHPAKEELSQNVPRETEIDLNSAQQPANILQIPAPSVSHAFLRGPPRGLGTPPSRWHQRGWIRKRSLPHRLSTRVLQVSQRLMIFVDYFWLLASNHATKAHSEFNENHEDSSEKLGTAAFLPETFSFYCFGLPMRHHLGERRRNFLFLINISC